MGIWSLYSNHKGLGNSGTDTIIRVLNSAIAVWSPVTGLLL